MKKLNFILSLGLIAFSSAIFAETQASSQKDQLLQLSQKGCLKPIGFFPTPAKIMCIMNTFGISQKEFKSKALALVFNVCKGRVLVTPPAGITLKPYDTLGNCLSDPTAVMLINRELKAQGFPEVKVVNPDILKQPTVQSS
jgi:hypothetical protein